MKLTNPEIMRYGRHLIMPEVGVEGQEKLKASKLLMIGAGGLGSPAGLYLAASGVGEITILDPDVVDVSNLQRQILHDSSSVGIPKVESAKNRMAEVNPFVKVNAIQDVVSTENVMELVSSHDVVVDGTDNFETRYIVNDACVLTQTPNVYGSIFRFDGQSTIFADPNGPCYRCLYPEPPPPGMVPSCAEGGVLGVLPGIVGTIQATEALKILMGAGNPLNWPLADLRRAGDDVSHAENSQRPGLPGLRRTPDDYQFVARRRLPVFVRHFGGFAGRRPEINRANFGDQSQGMDGWQRRQVFGRAQRRRSANHPIAQFGSHSLRRFAGPRQRVGFGAGLRRVLSRRRQFGARDCRFAKIGLQEIEEHGGRH